MWRRRSRFDPNIVVRDAGFRRSDFIEPPPLSTLAFSLLLLLCFFSIPVLMVAEEVCLRHDPQDVLIVRKATLGLVFIPLATTGIVAHRRWRSAGMTALVLALFVGVICITFGYISMETVADWLTRSANKATT